MSSNDPSSDLDSRIAAIVESTVGRMRDDLMQRIRGTESRLHDLAAQLATESPAPEVTAPLPEPVPEPGTAAGDPTSDLFAAVVALDHGGSQQEVLAALLEGVGRFAGRSALFLTRSDGAQGWGSYGFEETAGEIQEVMLSYAEGPLAILAEGSGCVVLTADQCGELCNRMGAAPGAEGLLVPFVLRDRLAAALYVDRFADGPPLGRQALQLLAYVGAQAVEGLALRQRGETPTLQIATEAPTAPGVALWEGTAVEPEAAEPSLPEPPVGEMPVSEPPVVAPAMSAPEVTAPPEAGEAPNLETTLEVPAEDEMPAATTTQVPPTLEPEPAPEVDGEWALPPMALDEPEAAAQEFAKEPTQPLESLTEPAPAATIEEPEPWTETAGEEFSTVEVEPAPEIEPPVPTEAPSPPAEPVTGSASETTEVRPPTDVSGPGWAFTASRAAADAGDEAQHEEARRLARLLVTEIKLYNEEHVEEGRRGNDIYARLREDIDRSRQIFNERVDDAVRQEADYFHEEMVRILAAGNAEALGL